MREAELYGFNFFFCQMMKLMCETEAEYYLQHLVHQKLQGHSLPHHKCKGSILIELAKVCQNDIILTTCASI